MPSLVGDLGDIVKVKAMLEGLLQDAIANLYSKVQQALPLLGTTAQDALDGLTVQVTITISRKAAVPGQPPDICRRPRASPA